MITVIDYNMGNLRSVEKVFHRLNQDVLLTSKPDEIKNATKIVLPGVGNFKAGMEHLKERKLIGLLKEKALIDKVPVLGICLGMQLMTSFSEEGNVEGLGLIEADTRRFEFDKDRKFKVPHIGWNTLESKSGIALFDGLDAEAKFYFVHSYYVQAKHTANEAATTSYGIDFNSAIISDAILGVQFHPEKSHDAGLRLLQNFINHY